MLNIICCIGLVWIKNGSTPCLPREESLVNSPFIPDDYIPGGRNKKPADNSVYQSIKGSLKGQ